jgi:hypothetical protein
MFPVEDARAYPTMNRCVVKPNHLELKAGDIPLLPGVNAGDFFRQTKVISHTPIERCGGSRPPRDVSKF